MVMTKRCNKCGEDKPARDFYERGDGKLMGSCKLCHCLATSHRDPVMRPNGTHGGRALTALEETPCPVCKLRGHRAWDPVRCLPSSELVSRSARMGEWGWLS